MTKEELLEQFTADFKKTRGALQEVLEHNRAIDDTLVEDLLLHDHNKLEEHIEISKIIMDGVKGFNDLYKNAPIVLDSISKITEKKEEKSKVSIEDLMKNLDKTENNEKDKNEG